MNEKYVMGIAKITAEFINPVARDMIQEAKNLQKQDWFVSMVEAYYDRATKEQKSFENEVAHILASKKSDIVRFEALTHARSYKQIIVDILQHSVNEYTCGR